MAGEDVELIAASLCRKHLFVVSALQLEGTSSEESNDVTLASSLR